MAMSPSTQLAIGCIATVGLFLAAARAPKANIQIAAGVAGLAAGLWTYTSYSTASQLAADPALTAEAGGTVPLTKDMSPSDGGPPQGVWDKVRGWMPGAGSSQFIPTAGFM
jgi:hypothetical protein